MAAAAAHFYQIPLSEIAKALAGFKGIKRRLEVVDQVKGITLVDDFGHHPTALRETIGALRSKFPGRKLWALFEPRSNTTRRAVFQHDLPAALALADGVLMTKVARADQLKPEERLDPEQVIADIAKKGIPAHYEENTDTLVERLIPLLGPDDVVCAFSNGSFDGVLKKISAALKA
jgi:UDP-N-acetylmuramate: L-alanyl-gamma-D-glutamyl-meso-diaminopimelate ligase